MRLSAATAFLLLLTATATAAEPGTLDLALRARANPFKADDTWQLVEFRAAVPAAKTALVLCDVWDDHWCKPAAERCDVLAKRMGAAIPALKAKGVVIIHAPSDCMDFYKDHPARKHALAVPKAEMPAARKLPDPPLPVDATDGGCDCDEPVKFRKAWSRQHAAIPVADDDYVTDKGDEVYAVLKERGITTLLVAGVHTNMCVLHRSFAIKAMTRLGVKCVLVRDWTDAMYNPRKPPFVAHDEGTARVVAYIEAHWCPSTTSASLGIRP
jgi:nicotinamidase-related amidase